MTTQLDCSIGLKAEDTYGTAVVVDQFPEFTEETLDWAATFAQGAGLRVASRVARSGRRPTTPVKQMMSGDFTVEACTSGLGILLNAALGTVTNTVTNEGGTSYQQVHTPTTDDYLGSYTIQKGVPPLGGGDADAYTFAGSQCQSIEFACPNADLVTIKTTWQGQSVDTSTDYATPSYASSQDLFTFAQGAITIGGSVTAPTTTAIASGGTSVADIRDFDLTWDNGLDQNGFNFGGAGQRSRASAVGLSALTGTLTAEYDATTMRDALLDQTDLALVLTFTGAQIESGHDSVLQIYVPCLRLNTELPKSNAGDVIVQSMSFTGLDNLTADSPLYVVYVTADTTV
jgi:hypothetical protein